MTQLPGFFRNMEDLLYILKILQQGTEADLEAVAELEPSFPHSQAPSGYGSAWIIHAVAEGSMASVAWMLEKKVDLDFADACGETVLHTAIQRTANNKYEILALLLKAGAKTTIKGINDWTPAHMAAVYNDVEALKLLVQFGADLSIKTAIDWYATPLEEALHAHAYRDCEAAIRYLKSIGAP